MNESLDDFKIRLVLNEQKRKSLELLKNQERELLKKGIFRLENRYLQAWDMLIIFFACYNCFVLPVEIAFNQNKMLTGFNELRYANHVIDCFFFIDIIIGFRVTYRDAHTNEEIMNPKRIALNYLSGEFWLDLISTIPFDLIVGAVDRGSGDNFVALSMVKLSRVLRIQKLIMYLNSTDEVKNTLNLLKTVLIIILYLHLGACFWFFVVNRERLWNPSNWQCPRCAERDFFKSTRYADLSAYISD
jgi:hypothetical protein